MTTQTDVQQLIQGLVPSGVNNGNPNTVYNVPPPALDAFGNWAAGQLPAAASLSGTSLPDILATLPATGLPAWGGGIGTVPGVLQPALPPLGGGGGGGGGYVPPGTTTPPGTGGPLPPNTGGTVGPVGTVTSGTDGYGTPFYPTIMPWTGGTWTGGSTYGTGGGGGTGSFNLPGFLQGASGFGGTLMEVLDKLSEPFLPGDMVQQGNFNWRQAAVSLAEKLGIPVGAAAQMLGKGDQYKAWLASGYGDLQGDMSFGSTAIGNSSGFGMGQVNPITGQVNWGLGHATSPFDPFGNNAEMQNALEGNTDQSYLIEQIFGKGGPAPRGRRGHGRSATSAGSTVLASGPAAQAMYRDMMQARKEERLNRQAQEAINQFLQK